MNTVELKQAISPNNDDQRMFASYKVSRELL